jgi:hypothetical protein
MHLQHERRRAPTITTRHHRDEQVYKTREKNLVMLRRSVILLVTILNTERSELFATFSPL